MLAVLPSGLVTQPEARSTTATSPIDFLNTMLSSPLGASPTTRLMSPQARPKVANFHERRNHLNS